MSKEVLVELEKEIEDLKVKIFNLDEFLDSKKFFELSLDMQELLRHQYYAMTNYRDCLKKRIALINGWKKPEMICSRVGNVETIS